MSQDGSGSTEWDEFLEFFRQAERPRRVFGFGSSHVGVEDEPGPFLAMLRDNRLDIATSYTAQVQSVTFP